MYIPQKQLENLQHLHAPGKVMVLYGARRAGKTTLIQRFVEHYLQENPSQANRILLVERHRPTIDRTTACSTLVSFSPDGNFSS